MIRLTSFFILFVSASHAQVDFYSRVRNFSIELIHYTQIKTNGNVVLAPFSLWTLMSQVAFETGSRTRTQLFRSLILNVNQEKYSIELRNLTAILKEASDGATLINDNFVLVDNSLVLSSDFVDRMSFYRANILRLDFKDSTSARLSNILNKRNEIPPVFGPSDFIDTQMIMGNMFLFKGSWSTPFNKSNTRVVVTSSVSYDRDGSVSGNFILMSQEMKIPQSDIKVLEAIVSELSFGVDGKYCMLIISPYEGVSVNKVYRHLAQVTFKDIFDKLQNDVNEVGLKSVTLQLPRFEIQSFLVFNGPLNDMGVYDAFQPEMANFDKLSSEELYIGSIEQRTKISVTEDGIEAFSTIPANLEVAATNPSNTGRSFIFYVVNKATMTIVIGGINGRP